jgi:signal transduction histidine kinase
MNKHEQKLQRYPPVPWPILRGYLIFFHIITLLALSIGFYMTLVSAWGSWRWQDTVVCLALACQAGVYLVLLVFYERHPWPRWLPPIYFTTVLLLWLVEIWLSPQLFWLGFTFIGQMFGILSVLPALIGTSFVLAVMALKVPNFIVTGATLASWVSILVLLIYVSHLTRTSRERAHLVDQLQRAQQELEAARKKEAELAVLRERERLARDMHDTLGHNLVALSVQLEAVQRLYRVDPQAASASIDDLKRLTRSSMDELRRTLTGLRSPGLAGRPLKQALNELCEDFSRRNGLQVNFAWEAGEVDLPAPVAETLWRSAQEALTNVEKHAIGADQVTVRLQAPGSEVCLLVEDNGPGFQPRPAATGHFGIAGMRERVEGVGGRLAIDSAPGKGARLEVHIPTLEVSP